MYLRPKRSILGLTHPTPPGFVRSVIHPVSVLAVLLCFGTPLLAGDKWLETVIREDFQAGADRWQPTDPKAWKVVDSKSKRGKLYSQFAKSKYTPPYRSPLNMSLLKDVQVSDFILDADLQSTCREYNHRDMCLFFGHQDPAHFYYVHLGKKTDDHANQVFIVNGKARSKISTRTTPGTNWDDNWHKVRIVRKVDTGTIEIYFDDMKRPVMTAKDTTFKWGRIGLGSFDDTGNWDNIHLRGMKVEKPGK